MVHDGEKIFPDAEKVFETLQKNKKKIFIISNSGKRSSDNIERLKKLEANHILKSPMITSGDVCYELLINKRKPFQNIGNNYFVVLFEKKEKTKTNYTRKCS